jgi:hypothetical protein
MSDSSMSSPRRILDPLDYLVPLALAFPPLLAYGGKALGWPGGWLSTRVVLVVCIAIFLLLRLLRRDLSYHRIPGLGFVAPYSLLVIASVLWGVLGPYNNDAAAIANELLSWLILGAMFLAVAGSFHEERDLKTAGRVLIAVALVEVAYCGLQALVLIGNDVFVPSPVVELTQYARGDLPFGALRLYGTMPNLGPNFFGAFLLVPTALVFNRAFSHRGFARVAWLLAGGTCTAVIAATYSRGAMLGLAIALLMIPIWRRSWRGMIGMMSAITVAGLLVVQTPVGRHVSELYDAGQLDVSGNARVLLWKAILKSAADHPFGLGFNGWPRAARTSIDVGLDDPPATIGAEHPAENQWMRELADRGIPGLAALALLMGGLMRLTFWAADSRRSSGYTRDFLVAVGAASVGWAFVFLTGDHLMYDNVAGMFWYTIALALAATRDTVRPLPEIESSPLKAALVPRA